MHRTEGRLRDEHDGRLTALELRLPEWRAWLRLLRSAAAEFSDRWYAPDAEAGTGSDRSPEAPLLHGQALRIPAPRARDLLERLLAHAGGNGAPPRRPSEGDASELLQATLGDDLDTVDRLAGTLNLSSEALHAVGRFLALPLLEASARALAPRLAPHWPRCYCPVCGGRAGLAELSGLEGARVLRCDRCGTAWTAGWLSCAYCGERDHERLGALVPEGSEATAPRKVEICRSCRGYLKAFTTLQAAPLLDLWLRDLETVELDIAALERGYARPSGPGYRIDVRIVATDGGDG